MNSTLFPDEKPEKPAENGEYEQKLSNKARIHFNRLKREYSIDDPAGLLLLRAAFEAYDECRAAQVAMNGQPIFRDRFNQPQEHPACKVIRASRTQMIAALKALNLDSEAPDTDQ